MINALFAVDHYGGMGLNGSLPWPHNAADMKRFKELTTGHVVVMGHKTWKDPKMPKPLNGRTVYVAASTPVSYASTIKGNLTDRLLEIEKNHPNQIIWVIGGSNVLEQCEGIFDKLYLTHFKGSYKIDTKINMKKFMSGWSPKTASADANNNCAFVVYENLFKRIKTRT